MKGNKGICKRKFYVKTQNQDIKIQNLLGYNDFYFQQHLNFIKSSIISLFYCLNIHILTLVKKH